MNHSLSIITGPDDQKGTAILTVLFILVLLSTLAVYTTEDENIAIRRLQNQRDVEQSRQVVLAGEQWVIKALERDLLNAPLGVDYLGDEWALLQTDVVAIEDGQMQVQAIDESGKFNLNNLLMGKKWMIVDPTSASGTEIEAPTPWYGLFVRLLENTGIDVIYADAVLDWIDADDETTDPEGAEDGTYASADPPYLTANQPFVSVSELANVLGFGQAEMDALAPYVSALPVGDVSDPIFTKININTAP
ncbi:MAG: type II secretion system minor pseudopilin GspK, partial [Arenicellales bacterium]